MVIAFCLHEVGLQCIKTVLLIVGILSHHGMTQRNDRQNADRINIYVRLSGLSLTCS